MPKQFYFRHFFLLAFATVLLAACQKKSASDASSLRPEFNAAISQFSAKLTEGQGKEAIKFLDSVYPKFDHLSPLEKWGIYWNKHLYYLNYEDNVPLAAVYADSLELEVKHLEQSRTDEYARTIFARGNILLAQKKYNEAFKNYYDGRQYAIQYIDKCLLSNYTNELANIKLKQVKYNEAIKYYKLALKEIQECDTTQKFAYKFIFVQSKMNAIAMVYESMNNIDSAIAYYQQAVNFIQKTKATNPKQVASVQAALGVVYGNLGGAYRIRGNYKEAERLLLQSIAINERPGYEVQDAMTAKIKLARLYLETNRAKLAYTLLNNLKQQLAAIQGDHNQQSGIKLSLYRLLHTYFDQVGNIKEAYKAQTNYDALKDSIDLVNKGLKSADMGMAFELTEQKYKSAILKKESELKTVYLIAIGFVVLASLTMMVFFYTNFNKSKRYISKLKRLNYQNEQTMAALEQSQADNDRILQIVAHDLRNPLSGITGVVGLMLEEDFSEETKEELALIKATGENSLALVNELLQINFNMKDLKMGVVDMDELLQYCAELLKQKAETKNQLIIAHSFPAQVIGNREKIWRVLSNLIGNAIKFSPAKSTITVSMEKQPTALIVAVSDEGIGVPPNMASKLFEMFTPAKREGTAGEESFGMGLSICKQIMEAHGGKLWFENNKPVGTTFYFSLPLSEQE